MTYAAPAQPLYTYWLTLNNENINEIAMYSLKLCSRSLGFNTSQNAGLPQTAVGYPPDENHCGGNSTSGSVELFSDTQ